MRAACRHPRFASLLALGRVACRLRRRQRLELVGRLGVRLKQDLTSFAQLASGKSQQACDRYMSPEALAAAQLVGGCEARWSTTPSRRTGRSMSIECCPGSRRPSPGRWRRTRRQRAAARRLRRAFTGCSGAPSVVLRPQPRRQRHRPRPQPQPRQARRQPQARQPRREFSDNHHHHRRRTSAPMRQPRGVDAGPGVGTGTASCAYGVAAGEKTSCAFAETVDLVVTYAQTATGYVPAHPFAYSQVTRKTYRLSCEIDNVPDVQCSTASGATASFAYTNARTRPTPAGPPGEASRRRRLAGRDAMFGSPTTPRQTPVTRASTSRPAGIGLLAGEQLRDPSAL